MVIREVDVLLVTVFSTADINVHGFLGLALPVALMNKNVVIIAHFIGQSRGTHFVCRMVL